ncbi:glycosyltransferase [Cryobacterium sp. N19]|uniref:glycosyltransferase n=1 Tax=Cryobacterium sp. N19 TaxID=2048288 RepID=UPI000CE43CE8|nr:glycosyltransferase [Cryobacterium sp. N19]
MKIVFLTPDISQNSIGRTYCLWQLAESLGWTSKIVSTLGVSVWGPLRGSHFGDQCTVLSPNTVITEIARFSPDLIIAVKPLPESFGLALHAARETGIPILLDIDDPDLEAQLAYGDPIRRIAKTVLRSKRMTMLKSLRSAAMVTPTIVSNPILQATYGGAVVPHVRPDLGFGATHQSGSPTIAFVGTARRHKGLKSLRAAVAQSQGLGVNLIITDTIPPDAKVWEEWVGETSMERGQEIVLNSDIVIIPSLNSVYGRGQFPVKVVDAMLSGRAIAVTEVGPLPWAVGDGGLVVRPGSVAQIKAVISTLADPVFRRDIGIRARARALAVFSVGVNRDNFARACCSASDRDSETYSGR